MSARTHDLNHDRAIQTNLTTFIDDFVTRHASEMEPATVQLCRSIRGPVQQVLGKQVGRTAASSTISVGEIWYLLDIDNRGSQKEDSTIAEDQDVPGTQMKARTAQL